MLSYYDFDAYDVEEGVPFVILSPGQAKARELRMLVAELRYEARAAIRFQRMIRLWNTPREQLSLEEAEFLAYAEDRERRFEESPF